MDQNLQDEQKNKRVGFTVSIVIHALLFVLFMIFAAYRAPYPPNPGIPGVELNFGLSDEGWGETQPEPYSDPNGDREASSSSAPDISHEAANEVVEQPVEHNDPDDFITSSDLESPVVAEDIKPVKPVENKPAKDNKPKEDVSPKPEPVVQPRAVMPDPSSKATGSGSANNTGKPGTAGGSHGVAGGTGDQGSESGSVDARALYGTPGAGGGGGDGPKLNMAGWNWDKIPDKKDPSKERGYILFEFKVDDYGNVEWIKTKEVTVSPSVENFYKEQLRNTTFSPEGRNIVNYIGRVRFDIIAK